MSPESKQLILGLCAACDLLLINAHAELELSDTKSKSGDLHGAYASKRASESYSLSAILLEREITRLTGRKRYVK